VERSVADSTNILPGVLSGEARQGSEELALPVDWKGEAGSWRPQGAQSPERLLSARAVLRARICRSATATRRGLPSRDDECGHADTGGLGRGRMPHTSPASCGARLALCDRSPALLIPRAAPSRGLAMLGTTRRRAPRWLSRGTTRGEGCGVDWGSVRGPAIRWTSPQHG